VARPGRWAGPFPAALGVRVADPQRKMVALSGDYDFGCQIELAVGAQFKLLSAFW
jgi:tartronate-semialdehyde synthase